MSCDICGKTGTYLVDLLPSYKSDGIEAICPACEKVVNAKSFKMMLWAQGVRAALTRRFMTEERARRLGLVLTKGEAGQEGVTR